MEKKSKISFENTKVAFFYKSDNELRKAQLLFLTLSRPWVVKLSTGLAKLGLNLKLPIKGLIKNTIYKQFCGGETIEECNTTIKKLAAYGIGTILDYSVEGAESEYSFDETVREILKNIQYAKDNKDIPFCVFKMTGIVRFGLLEKVQSGELLTENEQKEWANAKERVNLICSEAYAQQVRIFIDAEESWIQDPIDQLIYKMMELYNKDKAIVYNTYQMYRKDMPDNLIKAYEAAKDGGYQLGAKLVRGAYMEKERNRAKELGYESPIQPNKDASDKAYNDALKYCVEHIDKIAFCSGSHNEYSNLILTELMSEKGIQINDERVFSAQLFGMSDHISFNLAVFGYNVTKYVPYGPVEFVMPYLFRRAEENTSIAGQTSRELSLIKKEIRRRKQKSA